MTKGRALVLPIRVQQKFVEAASEALTDPSQWQRLCLELSARVATGAVAPTAAAAFVASLKVQHP